MAEKKKQLVLVVEDEPNSQMLMKYFLRDTYDICFAESVSEAKKRWTITP